MTILANIKIAVGVFGAKMFVDALPMAVYGVMMMRTPKEVHQRNAASVLAAIAETCNERNN